MGRPLATTCPEQCFLSRCACIAGVPCVFILYFLLMFSCLCSGLCSFFSLYFRFYFCHIILAPACSFCSVPVLGAFTPLVCIHISLLFFELQAVSVLDDRIYGWRANSKERGSRIEKRKGPGSVLRHGEKNGRRELLAPEAAPFLLRVSAAVFPCFFFYCASKSLSFSLAVFF